jgi:hypothetical protein
MAITDTRQVTATGQLTNEYTSSEILTEIDIVEANLYDTYNLPKRAQVTLDTDYSNFYFSTDKVHEIIRVQVAVDTTVDPSGYITVEQAPDTWSFLKPNNYITFSDTFLNTYDAKLVRIQYIPLVYNTMATIITVLNLIDTVTIVDGEEQTPPLIGRLKGRLERLKRISKPKSIFKSSELVNYDKYDYISITQSNFR